MIQYQPGKANVVVDTFSHRPESSRTSTLHSYTFDNIKEASLSHRSMVEIQFFEKLIDDYEIDMDFSCAWFAIT